MNAQLAMLLPGTEPHGQQALRLEAGPAVGLEAVGLRVNPTPAMRAGTQRVYQHAWCGTVVVIPTPPVGASWPRRPGTATPCPGCTELGAWWEQELPVAGLEVAR